MAERVNADIISGYMKENGLSKTEFCKQCKICIATLNNILQNKSFNLLSLFKVAKRMNVPMRQLFEQPKEQ